MTTSYLRRFALFQRDVRLYLISLTIALFVVGIWGVLFNLLLVRLGYGPEFVGLVSAAGSLVYAVSCLLSGAMAKWLGSRRMITFGFCLGTLATVMAGSGQFVPRTLQSGWLVICSLCGWAAFAMYYSNGIPFLIQATSKEERNHAFSVRGALMPLTGFLGGVLGGVMPGLLRSAFGSLSGLSPDHPSPYSYSLLLAGAASLPAIVVMLTTDKVGAWDSGEAEDRTDAIPLGVIGFVAFFCLVYMVGQRAAFTFFNIYLDLDLEVSTAQIGVLLALAKLVAAPAALAFPVLAKRMGEDRTLIAATVGVAVSLAFLALVPHWSAAALGLAGTVALGTVATTSVVVYSQKLVTQEWQSVMSGALTMAIGLGITSSTLAGGYVIEAFGYRPLFAAGAVTTVASAGLFWAYFRVPRGELAQSAPEPAAFAVD
ncbi:MAG: MFS transporter [Anaerolineae bacterium]